MSQSAPVHLPFYKQLSHRKIWVLFLLGFASGLPFVLIGSTLAAWFTQASMSLIVIGSLSLLRQPYAYKIGWAPICDVFRLPWLDRRRGWLFATQLACIGFLIIMSRLDPATHFWMLIGAALCVAVASATQDIVSSAYLADSCNAEPHLRGLGAASYTTGYRIALIIGGALSLILSQYVGWQATYAIMSVFLLLGLIGTYYAPPITEKNLSPTPSSAKNAWKQLLTSFTEPFQRFDRRTLLIFIITVIFYKLGDAFTVSLNTPFLYALGFTMSEIAVGLKTMGMLATILGGLVAGILMMRLSLFNALLYFGIMQTLCNLTYYWLALVGHDYALMIFAIFSEYFSSGLGTAAFMALIMHLCHQQYSATQYALWSAIGALGSIFGGPIAGELVHHFGWAWFYMFSFLIGIPGVVLLFWIKPYLSSKT